MSLRDTFARGFVWKLAGLLALAAFGWLAGISEAKAQDFSSCRDPNVNLTSAQCPDREQAYAGAKDAAAKRGEAYPGSYFLEFRYTGGNSVTAVYKRTTGHELYGLRTWVQECIAPKVWDDTTKTCKQQCDPNGAPLSGGYMKYTGSEPGYQTCSDGCEYNPSSMTFQTGTIDGISFVSLSGWIPSGASCTVGPNDGYIPPSDSDGDGTSDGNDTAPANPGQGAGGGEEPGGEDGGQPGEGSGNGNTSSGGGDCGTPPNSHGDEILAQVAYQAWATRCAIEEAKDADGNLKTAEKGEGTGTGTGGSGTNGLGTCSASEVGTAMCTMKEALASVKGFLDGIGTEAGQLDTSEGETEEPSSVWAEEEEEIELDSGGLGWGSACPTLPQVSIGGYGGSIDDGTLCNVLSALGALILLLAYFHAYQIIGR